MAQRTRVTVVTIVAVALFAALAWAGGDKEGSVGPTAVDALYRSRPAVQPAGDQESVLEGSG